MNTRYTAMWFGLGATVAGVAAILAAVAGDLRVEVTWGLGVAAIALAILAIGALVAPYRTLYAAVLMAIGVIGVLVGQWTELSKYAVDLWTSGTGGLVSYTDASGLTHVTDFWAVLFGSVSAIGYAGTLILGTIGAVVAFFAPEEERVGELRPQAHPI